MIYSKAYSVYSSGKILNGPVPETKTIAIWRSIVTVSATNSNQRDYDHVFMGLYLVNITSPSLEFVTLM